jgi:hypothetical protein
MKARPLLLERRFENPRRTEYGAMTKKKAKSKIIQKPKPRNKNAGKGKQELNPAGVRKDISQMVESEATTMAQAVIDEGKKGQLATVKYLFEMASIFPPSTDGSHATADEDCLAKTLLRRLDLPEEPVGRDEEDDVKAVSADKPVTEEKREADSKAETGEGSGESATV